MLQLWIHPALVCQISSTSRAFISSLCIQLSSVFTKDHFIHQSASQTMYSVIQCHRIGPFHTHLGFASRHISYLTIFIVHECLQFRVFLFYVLLLTGGSVIDHEDTKTVSTERGQYLKRLLTVALLGERFILCFLFI